MLFKRPHGGAVDTKKESVMISCRTTNERGERRASSSKSRALIRCLTVCVYEGLAMEKDGRSSTMGDAEVLDEEDDDGDDDEEGGAETEEQSGNESEMNEHEEDVSVNNPPP